MSYPESPCPDCGYKSPCECPTTAHTTSLKSAGSYYSWSCTCGKTSRRLQPLYKADRNAKAHVRKAIRSGTGLLAALKCEAAIQRYCRNCGDPAPSLADGDWNGATPSGMWRPCPNPSPGRPMIDCGVGGHMYIDSTPRID